MNKLIFLLLVCAPALALGQDVRFRFPTEPASWTVTCQKAGQNRTDPGSQSTPRPGDPGHPPEVKKVEVAQTDAARRSLIFYSDGHTKEVWSLPKSNAIVTEEPSGETMVSTSKVFGNPFDESSFDWIKTATRTSDKPVQYEGVDCIHYSAAVNEGSVNLRLVVPYQAWIKSDTLLPVALLKGDILGKFSYGPPPDSLVMPDKFKKRLDYYKLVMGLK